MRPPDFLTLPASEQSSIMAFRMDRKAPVFRSASDRTRIQPPAATPRVGIRVIADRKGIKQLEKIDKGRRKQFFPKGFHPQLGHDRDKIELFADQFLLQCSDHSRFELDIRIQKQHQFGLAYSASLAREPKVYLSNREEAALP